MSKYVGLLKNFFSKLHHAFSNKCIQTSELFISVFQILIISNKLPELLFRKNDLTHTK